ncbi:MFS transporter [Gephyromycinifex aptenodytis]|uniref:MFS transporter n=1 Tax=Gephyromycinifex aptenodytis TaxID=2716227 RepID=UPI0014485CFA|nr:MFS transporter [Gephyromycinifex aptenodytis]
MSTAQHSAPTLTGRSRWIALGVLAAALAMIILDGSIVGIALPRIITDLNLDLTDAQWVNSLYSMIFAALLLSFGSLGDHRGRRNVLVVGVLLFTGASVAAALATGAGSLIAARAVQGIGGAMVLPATLSTVNATFRGRDRAVAFGIWGAVMSGAAAVGPLLGGWLTTSWSWRWIFWVNLPIGLAVITGALLVVPNTHGAKSGPGIDVDGLLTSSIGLGLLVFGLIEGTSLGWWTPRTEFSLFGITWPSNAPVSVVPVAIGLGLAFIVLFWLWERHRAGNGRAALLDLRLWSIPTFTWGNLAATMVAAGEFALVFILPLYLVNAAGLSVMGAGFVLATMALGAFISGASARHLAERTTPTRVVILGLGLEVVGVIAALFAMGPHRPAWIIAAVLAVYGIGLGLASAQLTSTVLRDVPPAQSGAGSATQSTFRQVGAALGAASAGTCLAIALDGLLPGRLSAIAGLPATAAAHLATATRDSAGGIIEGIRASGVSGEFGNLGPAVADVLATTFTDAARVSLLTAGVFLALGLIGALRVDRVARTNADAAAQATAAGASSSSAVSAPAQG